MLRNPIHKPSDEFMNFWQPHRGTKHSMDFKYHQGVHFLENYDDLPELVAFARN